MRERYVSANYCHGLAIGNKTATPDCTVVIIRTAKALSTIHKPALQIPIDSE